jgi:hypothetical protein
MEQAEVADFLKALGHDMREAPAETLHAVEVGGAAAGTAAVPVGARDGAVREADETVVGDGALEARGSAGGAGGVSMVIGLTGDGPGDVPDLWVDVLQESGLAHLLCPHGALDGGEGFHGDKEVGSRGQPR